MIIVAAAGYFCWRLYADWPLVARLPVRAWPLAAAACALAAALAGQVRAWQWNLARLAAPVSYHGLFRVYYIANLARYIPGKIWSLAGMVAGGHRLGVAPEIMSASLLLGLASSLVSGLVIGIAAAAAAGHGSALSLWLLAVPVVALLSLWPPVFRSWAGWLLRRLGRSAAVPLLSGRLLARSTLHYGLVWCAYAGAAALLGRAFGADAFWLYFAAFPLAYLAGYAALFAPGGWGVRESTLVVLAGGGATALAVALMQRLLLTLFELGLFSYSVWSWRHD